MRRRLSRELRLAGGAVVRGELGRQPDPVAHAELGHQVAQHVLGIAVIGRGVDDAGAAGDETPQHFLQRSAAGRIHLETARGAHADHRDGFAGGGNHAFRQAGCRGRRGRQGGQGVQHGGCCRERGGRDKGAATGHGGTSWQERKQRWCVSVVQFSVRRRNRRVDGRHHRPMTGVEHRAHEPAPELLVGGSAAYACMWRLMRLARTTVELETYIDEAGAVGDRFLAELTGAARRGVRVRVLVDAMVRTRCAGAISRR